MSSRSRSETQLKSWLLIILMVGLTVILTSTLDCKDSGLKKEVQIAADVNRDGKVEFRLDEKGKSRWTPERGAIFLNNNDSDQDTGAPDHADEVV
jgi:hypothetical protein